MAYDNTMNEIHNGLNRPDTAMSNGSYTKLSYLALHNPSTTGRNSPRHPRSNIVSPQKSAISLSQLKLDQLNSCKKGDGLEDFQLEELRDGFFDANYIRPDNMVSLDGDDGTATSKNKGNSSMLGNLVHNWKGELGVIYARSLRHWKHILKFFLAYLIAMILCVIRPAGSWIAHKYRYFLPIIVILHHPARNIGVQIEMTIEACVGLAFGLGWSALAWYVSTATGPTASHQGGSLFQSLVMALWFIIWLKAYYNRLFYFSQAFGMTILFTHTVDLVFHASDLEWILYRDFALSYVFGLLLCLLVCVVIFPTNGNAKMIKTLDDTMISIKNFLMVLVDREKFNDVPDLTRAQREMIRQLTVDLSLVYRDFENQFTIFNFKPDKLKALRDSLTVALSPLRVIPVGQRLFDNLLLDKLYEEVDKRKAEDVNQTGDVTADATPSGYDSGLFTPVSGVNTPLRRVAFGDTSEFYINILKKKFSSNTLNLILEMIVVIDKISKLLQFYKSDRHNKEGIEKAKKDLARSKRKLKRKMYNIDKSYNKFIESNLFTEEIIKDFDCVDIFLFIRYSRSSAKQLLAVLDATVDLDSSSGLTIWFPRFSRYRTLHRLPDQCLMDQGLRKSLRYFESKKDVDEIFERSYNSYTSRHMYSKKDKKLSSTRAIDHTDFNFHTTDNALRFKLWKFTKQLSGREMKWTMKCLFCIIFLCLPTWLPESYHWYQEYQCWWAAMIFFILNHNKPAGKLISLINRLMCGIIGMFWGWAACQARHFGSPYVICTFAGLISVPFAINHLVYRNAKSSNTALICFTIIALEAYSKDPHTLRTSVIWKNCWTTSLSLIIGIIVSISINWIFWSYKSRTELRLAMSFLLSHLSQSYQSVAERYLYRDLNDDPTELSLVFSHIREVRLTRNIEAVKEVLERTKREPIFVANFDPDKYSRLINTCQDLFEQMVEARISGTYFEIWNQDVNSDVTRALLSLRRDSISTVIYVFYILSNCFRSKNKIPRYLPSSVVARKKLFNFMSQFDKSEGAEFTENGFKEDSLEKQLFKRLGHRQCHDNEVDLSPPRTIEKVNDTEDSSNTDLVEEDEEARWKDIYGVAFARSFTGVCQTMDVLIECCKDILGEQYV